MPTKTSVQTLHSTLRTTTTFTNGNPPTKSSSSFSLIASRTFSGSENPRWKDAIRRGEDATTPAVGHIQICSGFPEGKGQFVDSIFGTRYEFTGTCDFAPPRANTGAFYYGGVDSAARIKFINKFKEARVGFQSGIFLGELRETLQMIRRPASAFRRGLNDYYRDVKRRTRKKRSVKHLNDAVAGTWLEYSYGWQPLVSDIDSGMRALASLPQKHIVPIRASAYEDLPRSSSRSINQILGPIWCEARYQNSGTVSARYIGAVSAETSPTSNWEKWGFTPSEIVPTIWELIPYSFLVDYFTNIGDIVSASSFGNIKLAWGCHTLRGSRTVFTNAARVYSASATAKGSGSGGSFRDEYRHFMRSGVSNISVGVSDFRFEIPGMGSSKWLNIAALGALRT